MCKSRKNKPSCKRVGRRAVVKKAGKQQHVMWKRQSEFLVHYKRAFSMGEACGMSGISRASVHTWRTTDPIFKADMDQIKEDHVDLLESKTMHRAVHGTLKPVWQGGELMGYVHEHNHSREAFMLAAHRPSVYRPNDGPADASTAEETAEQIHAAREAMLASMTSGEERETG